MQLLEKIEQLKAKYTDPIDAPQLAEWEKEAQRILLVEGIAGSDAIKMLTDQLQSEVDSINGALLAYDSTDIPDTMRDRMLDKKVMHQKIIDFFDVEQARANLEAKINEN